MFVLWSGFKRILLWEVPATRYDRWGLYTQVILLVAFFSLMELRPSYTGHPISTGYAIAALAFAAVIMAARADSLTTTEKIVWILLSAVLFIWELNVIDRDHEEQDRQHSRDIIEQGTRFGLVLSAQNQTFLATSKSLQAAYTQSNQQFSSTTSTLAKEQKDSDAKFSGVLAQQSRTLDERHNLSEQLTGRLVPGDGPTPSNACLGPGIDPPDGSILTMFGDNGDIVDRFPHDVLEVGNTRLISVDRENTAGAISIALDFRDSPNRILFRMDKDGVVNRSGLIFLHPNKSTFLAQDEFGTEFLRAEYVNPKVFRVTGNAIYCGKVIDIQEKQFHNSCTANAIVSGWVIEAPPCPMTPQ